MHTRITFPFTTRYTNTARSYFRYLDFMNILSYDYHSAYEPNVNHHSPLYSLQEESEYNFDAQLTIVSTSSFLHICSTNSNSSL